MKQLTLFAAASERTDSSSSSRKDSWLLSIDGAARNNPGPAGAGIYLLKNDEVFLKEGFYLGSKTNNQAEYLALLLGVYFLEQHAQPGDNVRILSDSELLVKQINGVYRIKNPALKPLHDLAQKTITRLECVVSHVLREQNVQADKMANVGIDKKKAIPSEFKELLERHDISL